MPLRDVIEALSRHCQEAPEIAAQVRQVALALEQVALALETGAIGGKYPVSPGWITDQLRPSREFWKEVARLKAQLPPEITTPVPSPVNANADEPNLSNPE